ncbi:General transcription factor IIH subunit 1 [Porphyridium purpureum]|uniref:General transcription factor IIH subunit 1 n=1 Tax=Porphyridium purpureum TaxID=35688 RepID=A0A5J4YMF0_PORPP|nr:General transcription factor IIH subunit 1 [Porphyridium purpureum]|eukprot:POR7497..scf295_9
MSLIERECRHRKAEGMVRVSENHVVWTAQRASDGVHPVRVPIASVSSQMATPAGAKSALIKLVTVDNPKGIVFDFGADGAASRNAVRDVISSLLQLRVAGSSSAGIAPSAGAAQPQQTQPVPPPISLENVSPQEAHRRAEILNKNEMVSQMHAKLVLEQRAVSDADFWKGIEFRLRKAKEATSVAQQQTSKVATARGMPTALQTTVQGTETDAGTQTFRFTPTQMHQIFVEQPEVHRAYKALVPRKMDEQLFWKKYVQSRILQSEFATGDRSDMFAKFQMEAEREEGRELRQRAEALRARELQLDRRDDHKSVHNEGAHCMDDGSSAAAITIGNRKSKYMPLVRRYNRHGTLVLDSIRRGVAAASPSAGSDADTNAQESETAQTSSCWEEPAFLRDHPMLDLEAEMDEQYLPLHIQNVRVFVDNYVSDAPSNETSANHDTARTSRDEIVRHIKRWKPSPDLLLQVLRTSQACSEMSFSSLEGSV